jgi:hypothetical protein
MPVDQPASPDVTVSSTRPLQSPATRAGALGRTTPTTPSKSSTSRTVRQHDEAEDLTQDIFLKIFKSLDTFDRRANFQTWLISISRNLCIDHYRSVRKERKRSTATWTRTS